MDSESAAIELVKRELGGVVIAEIPNPAKGPVKGKEEKGKASMSNTTESPYSMTFKTGKGNLFTVRGDDAETLAFNLAQASLPVSTDDGPMSVLDMIREIESSLSGGAAQAAQTAQGGLLPSCPTCGGSTEQKSGTGSKGPWTGYFCSTGDKSHKVSWAK